MAREGTQRSGVALRAVVDVTDSLVHLVTDAQMAAGRHAGRYLAVCGHTVASASLMGATGV
jgi:hypothetical protein